MQNKQRELPDEWGFEPLSKIADVTNGNSPDSEYYNTDGDGTPFIQGNSGFGWKTPETDRFCSTDGKLAEPRDVLLSVRGATLGETNIADAEYIIGRGVAAISGEQFNQEYLYHLITSQEEFLQELGTGSTFGGLSSKDFNYIRLPVPSLNEQKQIASVLYTVDETLKTLQERQGWLEQHKRALMQDFLTGETRVQPSIEVRKEVLPTNSPAEIKQDCDWKEKKIEDITQLRRNNVQSDKQQGLSHVGLEHLESFSLNHASEPSDNVTSNKYRFEEGEILFGQIRSYLKKVCIANTDGVCSTDIFVIQPQGVNRYYLWALLLSDEVNKWSQRASTGTKMPRVQWNAFSNKSVTVPPLWEQERIASVLYTVEDMIAKTTSLIDEYERLKRGLMQDLLCGEVRTPPELEVIDEVEV